MRGLANPHKGRAIAESGADYRWGRRGARLLLLWGWGRKKCRWERGYC